MRDARYANPPLTTLDIPVYEIARRLVGGALTEYGGRGLLVWHILELRAWDLESAAGKFAGLVPDPIGGKDALESSPYNLGSAADFFDGRHRRFFSGLTNPNTNLYAGMSQYGAPQTRPSSISIWNIRPDRFSTDMLLNISLETAPTDIGPAPLPRLDVQAHLVRGGAEFSVDLPHAGRARLDLYSVTGRRVARAISFQS